jgi:hypothetical protein
MEIDNYTARVLDVIKGKFGLKNRGEALKKLALEAGDKYIELAPNETTLKEIDDIYESHKHKHGKRTIDDGELKKLLGL